MLIATFLLPPEAVALERTIDDRPDLELEAERIAAHSTEWTMPCLWAAADDFDALDAALRADPSVDRVVEAHAFDDEKYYQLDWSDEVIDRIDAYVDQGGSVLHAGADADGWRVRIRFASRDQFDAFREHVTERGHSFELVELSEPGAPRQAIGQLTPGQRDALVVAMEAGYFDVPREASAEAIADELEISQQALSERLQRGMKNLIDAMLTTPAAAAEVRERPGT